MHELHLFKGVKIPHLTNECPRYDIKQSIGEAPALESWGMWSTPSLPLLLGSLCPRVAAPVRVQPIGQIELSDV